MRTRPLYSNCHFGLLYLLLRGTASHVVFAPGGNWLIPWHVGILTKNGHFLHFYRLLPHSQNTYGAWWFLGSFQGLRRSRWPEWISRRGNPRFVQPVIVLPLWLIGYVILFPLWTAAWWAFGPVWTGIWLARAIARRKQGARK